jgi:hypothetical protein
MMSLRYLFSARESAAISRRSSTKSLVVLDDEATSRGLVFIGIGSLLSGIDFFRCRGPDGDQG